MLIRSLPHRFVSYSTDGKHLSRAANLVPTLIFLGTSSWQPITCSLNRTVVVSGWDQNRSSSAQWIILLGFSGGDHQPSLIQDQIKYHLCIQPRRLTYTVYYSHMVIKCLVQSFDLTQSGPFPSETNLFFIGSFDIVLLLWRVSADSRF